MTDKHDFVYESSSESGPSERSGSESNSPRSYADLGADFHWTAYTSLPQLWFTLQASNEVLVDTTEAVLTNDELCGKIFRPRVRPPPIDQGPEEEEKKEHVQPSYDSSSSSHYSFDELIEQD